MRGVLFDLDDTLLVDDAHVEACFIRVTANVDGAAGVEPGTVARSVRTRARELWRSCPYHPLVMALGFSSWEGLAADFSGGHPSLHPLRQWVPTYRVESWTAGLEEFGATQHARELATQYRSERRESYRLVADALDVVAAFRRAGWAVGIVTNGPPDLQREKLTATGLLGHVDAVAISGELGCGKPGAAIFESLSQPSAATKRVVNLRRRGGQGAAEACELTARYQGCGPAVRRSWPARIAVRGLASRSSTSASWLVRTLTQERGLPKIVRTISRTAQVLRPNCILRRLGVEPSDALMVGDSVHRDMEGAASLSIPAVWCRNGRTDVRWPDSIDSLTELLPRLN